MREDTQFKKLQIGDIFYHGNRKMKKVGHTEATLVDHGFAPAVPMEPDTVVEIESDKGTYGCL